MKKIYLWLLPYTINIQKKNEIDIKTLIQLKEIPPAPTLSTYVNKEGGVMLSWNMKMDTDRHETVDSYIIYLYQQQVCSHFFLEKLFSLKISFHVVSVYSIFMVTYIICIFRNVLSLLIVRIIERTKYVTICLYWKLFRYIRKIWLSINKSNNQKKTWSIP